jgi:hypothetical protein
MIGSGKLSSISQLETLSNIPTQKSVIGIVYDVILDDTHPIIKENPILISHIGGVRIRLSNDISSDENSLVFAFPANVDIKSLPTKNEEVKVFTHSGLYFYERFSNNIFINTSADVSTISTVFKPVNNTQTDRTSDYRRVSNTGIPQTSTTEDNDNFELGKYFSEIEGLHRLKMYEGDTLIESRFGQSIRFSAYNNLRNNFSPTIIIRNGESIQSQRDLDSLQSTEEDVNKDGSIIVFGSSGYTIPFIPGNVSDNGVSDFETKPNSFQNYPTNLNGNQLLLNSGRVIISSKSGEMIFWSKRNYGFISDGSLSIDNKGGIVASVGADISITTNNRNVNINSGNGQINLGNGNLQPLVRGNELLTLLNELIDAITQQVYVTPAGNTSPGPINRAQFSTIKNRLRNILSSQNRTV